MKNIKIVNGITKHIIIGTILYTILIFMPLNSYGVTDGEDPGDKNPPIEHSHQEKKDKGKEKVRENQADNSYGQQLIEEGCLEILVDFLKDRHEESSSKKIKERDLIIFKLAAKAFLLFLESKHQLLALSEGQHVFSTGNLSCLPSEILACILSRETLSFKERVRLKRVCKGFKALVEDGKSWPKKIRDLYKKMYGKSPGQVVWTSNDIARFKKLYKKYPWEITEIPGLAVTHCKLADLSDSGDLIWRLSISDAGNQTLDLLRGFCNIRILQLIKCVYITDDGIQAMANACPNLTYLDLSGCKGVCDAGMEAIGKGCNSLSYLNLRGTQVTEAGLSYLRGLEKLSVLVLPNATNNKDRLENGKIKEHLLNCFLTERGIDRENIREKRMEIPVSDLRLLGSYARNITMLRLVHKDKTPIADSDIEYLADHCPNLIELDLCDTHVADTSLHCLHKLSNLKTLLLPNMSELSKLNLLPLLKFGNSSLPSDRKLEGEEIKRYLGWLPTMPKELARLLCTQGITPWNIGTHLIQVIPSELELLLPYSHEITKLRLLHTGMSPISDATAEIIGSNFPNLTHLDLTSAHVVDTTLQVIAQHCTKLNELRLVGCINITIDGFTFLAKHCNDLTVLDLGACEQVSDTEIEMITHHYPNLTELNLSSTRVSNKGLTYIASRCKNLTKLGLNGCKYVSSEGIQAIAQNCDELCSLHLNYIEISSADIMPIVDHCPKLTCLELCGCLGVGGVIEKIKKQRPQLRICYLYLGGWGW